MFSSSWFFVLSCLRGPIRFLRTFDGEGDAVAAAEAERGDAALQASRFQRVEQRRQHAAAARADRVAEPSGAAVDVALGRIDPELVEHGDRLHRISLVQVEL